MYNINALVTGSKEKGDMGPPPPRWLLEVPVDEEMAK
jgi:hypothetical protein